MKTLPDYVRVYKQTAEFSEKTVPPGLRTVHCTKTGVWGRIHVLEGTLVYHILAPESEAVVLSPGRDGVVEPEAAHRVELKGPVRFYVEFLRGS